MPHVPSLEVWSQVLQSDVGLLSLLQSPADPGRMDGRINAFGQPMCDGKTCPPSRRPRGPFLVHRSACARDRITMPIIARTVAKKAGLDRTSCAMQHAADCFVSMKRPQAGIF
jgi:hypothetical protein